MRRGLVVGAVAGVVGISIGVLGRPILPGPVLVALPGACVDVQERVGELQEERSREIGLAPRENVEDEANPDGLPEGDTPVELTEPAVEALREIVHLVDQRPDCFRPQDRQLLRQMLDRQVDAEGTP